MIAFIKQLSLISVVLAVFTLLIPEGGVKRVAVLLCTVILLSIVLEAARGFDFEAYATQLAKHRDDSAAIAQDSQQINRELNRLVIEDSCETYILDKGKALGLQVTQVQVQVKWSMDGVWYPVSAKICAGGRNAELESLIVAELGIPSEKLEWS